MEETVAKELNKRHSHVFKSILNILTGRDFGSVIIENEYKDKTDRKLKEYLLTEKGTDKNVLSSKK